MTPGYMLRRVGYVTLNLLVIVTIAFFLFRLIPGNPADIMVGSLASEELRQTIIDRYGLDDPLPLQYVKYMRSLVTSDLGSSLMTNRPVQEVIFRSFSNTLVLVLGIFVVSFTLGGLVGALLGWKRGTWVERVGGALELLVRGAPTFFVGVILILIFSITLDWLPSTGMRSGGFDETNLFRIYTSADFLKHLILPVVTGSLYAHVVPALIMRNTMIYLKHADFLDLARAKGLSERAVMLRHGVRNALMPLIAEGSQFLGWAVGGLVAIEFVFSWPGLGREIVHALDARDYPVAQGAFLFIAVLVLLVYFAADLLASLLDPRVRRRSSAD